MRRLVIILGLVSMGTGLWIIIANQAKNSACNGTDVSKGGFGMSNECIHISYTYFGGFILIIVGFFTVAFGMVMFRRSAAREGVRQPRRVTGPPWEHTPREMHPTNDEHIE